jgi:hypothetical protein
MTQPSTSDTRTTERLQDGVLVCIVLLVGAMAGAASFSHVHDWTMTNSPERTGDWFGWANAVISELIPTAALIIIGRRRRHGAPTGYPMFLLVAAVALSLTAQLAVAKPTVFGWMVSALPALAFFALSKLVFTTTRPTTPVPAPTPATVAPAPSPSDNAPATVRPAAAPEPGHHPTPRTVEPTRLDPGEVAPVPASPHTHPAAPAGQATPDVPDPAPVDATNQLLPGARIIAAAHAAEHGQPITAGQLAVRLRIPTPTAARVLDALTTTPATTPAPHNGARIGATR